MGSLLFMGNPYPHAPEVSIVRTDTCSPCPVKQGHLRPADGVRPGAAPQSHF